MNPLLSAVPGFAIGIGDEIALTRRMSDKGLGAAQLGDGIGQYRQRPPTKQQKHGDGAERRPNQGWLGIQGREYNTVAGKTVSHNGMLRNPLGGVKAVRTSPFLLD